MTATPASTEVEKPHLPASNPSVSELRHRAEVPMFAAATVMTVIAIVVAVWATTGGLDVPGWAQAALYGLTGLPRLLFLGRSVTRAQEYTADRCAAYYAPNGATSMMALFAGKRMYRKVDLDAYFDSVENHKDGFWMKFANFWSGLAVGFRRMQPLRDLDHTGWDIHGKML